MTDQDEGWKVKDLRGEKDKVLTKRTDISFQGMEVKKEGMTIERGTFAGKE